MKARYTLVALSTLMLASACSSAPTATPVTSTVTAVTTTVATVTQTPRTITSEVISTMIKTVTQALVSTTPSAGIATPKPVPSAAASSPAAQGNGAIKAIGQAFDYGFIKVTVLDTKVPMTIGTHQPGSGDEFAGVLAQTCIENTPQPVAFTWHPWNLEDADGGQYPAAESAYEDTPKPEYPFSGTSNYVNGDCVKGWIMFEIPTSAKPVRVRYSTTALDQTTPLVGLWSVKA